MLVYGTCNRSRNGSTPVDSVRSIGTYNWDPVVELEYPEAFQQALLKVLDGEKLFTYVYLGGAFTEPDQEKTLWFFSRGRRVRVRQCPCSYNHLESCSSDILSLHRASPKHNSWSLESKIST